MHAAVVAGEHLGLDIEEIGGEGDQLSLGIFCRHLHGFTLAVGDATAAGWPGKWGEVGVALGNHHLGDVDAERLGDDLGKHGVGAGDVY